MINSVCWKEFFEGNLGNNEYQFFLAIIQWEQIPYARQYLRRFSHIDSTDLHNNTRNTHYSFPSSTREETEAQRTET